MPPSLPVRTLGRSLSVSALGLGCMGMSEFYGPTDEARGVRTVHAALDAGVNFLDTADMYGKGANEELVGRALRTWSGQRERVVVATKFGIVRTADPTTRAISGSPAYVAQACEASLKRLGLDVIDLYFQHRVDPHTPIEETVGAMAALVKAGKVRFLGLSEASAATIRRAHAVHPITALQTEYSLWSRDAEAEILPTCRDLGIGFVAYSPLGRGFLTGQIRSVNDLAPDDFRRNQPRFAGENFQKNLALVAHLQQVAARKGVTPAQAALAWVVQQGPQIVPIPGTTKPERVAENVGALRVTFSPAELAEIDRVLPPGSASGERYGPMGMKALNG